MGGRQGVVFVVGEAEVMSWMNRVHREMRTHWPVVGTGGAGQMVGVTRQPFGSRIKQEG